VKVIRDPVHDIIRIEDEFILDLVNSSAMQRLRRIRQLGLAWLVYPGAEHSRFTHSLGVYHLADRVMRQLRGAAETGAIRQELFDTGLRNALLAAAILHDVGHGPFSHVFENVSRMFQTGAVVGHESWSRRILQEDGEIRSILTSVSSDLPQQVSEIIAGTFEPHYVTATIGSQLDVDRFDYLLRDSLMTGCRYGDFDLEWMLRTLTVGEVTLGANRPPFQTVVVDGQRGISGLEMYVLGRHNMYQHVYYHKTIRAAERMLGAILRRAAVLVREGHNDIGTDAFRRLAKGEPIDVAAYCQLNDFLTLSWIDDWGRSHRDPILRDLSSRLTYRQLFKSVPVPEVKRDYADARAQVDALLQRIGKPPEYYFLSDDAKDVAYKGVLYNLGQGKDPDEAEIWCISGSEGPQRLSLKSRLLLRASEALTYQEERWFVPEEVSGEARAIVNRVSGIGGSHG
jgi:HD superfamily phosphohydrolase